MAPGLPGLVWDPITGCEDPMTAERRAKAFTAGTIKRGAEQSGDDAARFYAGEAAKVLQGYLHAAALRGLGMSDLLRWVSAPTEHHRPKKSSAPTPPPHRSGTGCSARRSTAMTAPWPTPSPPSNKPSPCSTNPPSATGAYPGPPPPATDLADVIAAGGTFYLLGREDPYASASPLMTAVTEHILDTALHLGNTSPWGRLCPPFLSVLDEMPSTAPIPTLATRMANERALGLSFLYAAQTWRQLLTLFGEPVARTILGLTNTTILFGGSKDHAWNQEISDLLGTTRTRRRSYNDSSTLGLGIGGQRSTHTAWEDKPIIRAGQIRQLPDHTALVIAENAAPILARTHRAITGTAGHRLLTQQRDTLNRIDTTRNQP